MVKTVATYVKQTHKNAFEQFLKETHRLTEFSLLEPHGTSHLSIQFYDDTESSYFDRNILDAKFLISNYSR